MKYAEIENNNIVEIYNVLPESWRNVSNFNSLTDQELSDLSWTGNEGCSFYPVETNARPSFNPLYEIFEPEYSIDHDAKKVTGSWVQFPVETEKAWDIIREQRTARLSATDWTQLSDSPLSEEEKNAYVDYRQKLRDITLQPDPFNIEWPQL